MCSRANCSNTQTTLNSSIVLVEREIEHFISVFYFFELCINAENYFRAT